MKPEGKESLTSFVAAINVAVDRASSTGFTDPLYVTLLADFIQIQCFMEDNLDLLEFEIPSKLHKTIVDVAKVKEAELAVFNTNKPDIFIVEFKNSDEQDKVLKAFEMMAVLGNRAYPCPDIYIGNEKADKQLCRIILEVIRKLFSDK